MPPNNPPQPRHWRRSIGIGLVVVFLVALLVMIGLTVGLKAYLHSDRFRLLVSESISEFLCADGAFMPIRWTGFSAYSDGYLALGRTETKMQELRADQIRAEFYPRGLFRRTLQVNDLEMQQLNVSFGDHGEASSAHAPAKSTLTPVWLLPWLPERIELQRLRVQDVRASWSAASTTGSLRQVRALIIPEGAAWIVDGTGGQLRQSGFPPLNVDRVRMRYRGSDLFITDSQLRISESETINVTGEISFKDRSPVNLQVKYRGISITPFLPEDWRARLKGRAGGEAQVTGTLDPQLVSLMVTGALDLTGGQLEALPILDRIALFTRTDQYRHLTLQTANAEYVWTPAKLTIRKLVLESSGLLRIEGDCNVARNELDGTFQVGVSPNSLRWIPGSQARVFTEERGGYVWTTVRVTGPLDRLEEDLSARLVAAAGTEVIEGVKGTVEKGARDLLDLLKPLVP